MWEDIPSTSQLRVYIFNLTNPDEFEDGEKPVFKEMGPYVFQYANSLVKTIASYFFCKFYFIGNAVRKSVSFILKTDPASLFKNERHMTLFCQNLLGATMIWSQSSIFRFS